MTTTRYRAGCAGMFMLGMDFAADEEDEAIVACETTPGCEVYDSVTGEWIGPSCMEDIDEAQARLSGKYGPREST